jgi:hypothetical protein
MFFFTPQFLTYDMRGMRKVQTAALPCSANGICLNDRSDETMLITLTSSGSDLGIYDTRVNKIVLTFGIPETHNKTNGHYRASLNPSGQLVASGPIVVPADSNAENYIWDLRWQGINRNAPVLRFKSQHKNAMQRFLWWTDKSYFSTSTGTGCEYVDLSP